MWAFRAGGGQRRARGPRHRSRSSCVALLGVVALCLPTREGAAHRAEPSPRARLEGAIALVSQASFVDEVRRVGPATCSPEADDCRRVRVALANLQDVYREAGPAARRRLEGAARVPSVGPCSAQSPVVHVLWQMHLFAVPRGPVVVRGDCPDVPVFWGVRAAPSEVDDTEATVFEDLAGGPRGVVSVARVRRMLDGSWQHRGGCTHRLRRRGSGWADARTVSCTNR